MADPLQLVTFEDIVDAIMEAVGIQASDTKARNKVKRFINMYYLDEVVPFKRWTWLEKTVQIVHKEAYIAGTVSVTPDSTAVTLDAAPNITEGSFKGFRFSVEGHNQVYTIASHTTASATFTLTSKYQEALDGAAKYKIWRDRIDLPTDAKETIELWHAEQSKPLDAIGSQEFRKYEAKEPKLEGFPIAYNTWDFYNPDSPDAETESTRFRQTRIYPSITSNPVTINVDYTQEADVLTEDNDEPLLPIGDRSILYYGAGAMAWSVLSRNEEMHDKWLAKANTKLERMAGDRDDGFDTPSLRPKKGYVNNIRRSGLRRRVIVGAAATGGSSVALPSYLKDVVIDGATLRNDMSVDSGILIDGRDISEDGAIIDSLVSPVSVTLTDDTTNQVAASFAVSDEDIVHIQYSLKRNGEVEAGVITICTNGTTASIAQGAVAQTALLGVSFDADFSAGNLRLLATSSNTGFATSMKYRSFKWLG